MSKQDKQPITSRSLAQAFKCWEFTPRLGQLPLSRLEIVHAYRASAGYADSEAGRGRALRELLVQVVEALSPPDEEPDFHDKRWRTPLILRERFIKGLSPDFVAEQFGVARSTYNHEQLRALEKAAELLLAWEAEGSPGEDVPERMPSSAAFVPPFNSPPRLPQGLVGREALLDQVRGRLSPPDNDPLLALYGLPGMGKTSLAIELAHDPVLRACFPDGVLWAGLGAEADAAHWLTLWGTALGMQPEALAGLVDNRKRAQAVHAAIGERHVLLIVDDVWQVEDGLAFRLGGPNTAVLFTTRFPAVAHELAPEGALLVGELDEAQGIQLLGRYVPSLAQRRENEAKALVALACGLPMALVLIGGYLRREAYSGQSRRLAQAIDRLGAIEQVLDMSGPGSVLEGRDNLDPAAGLTLRRLIELSEAALTPGGVRALRALALHPPKPSSFPEMAALAILEDDASALDELVDMGLLEVVGEARYSMHSAINSYGRQQDEARARERYIEFWLVFLNEGEAGAQQVFPEMANLQRALDLAEAEGDWPAFVSGVNDFYPYLERSGRVEDGQTHLEKARAHLDAGEGESEMRTLAHLGRASQRTGEYRQARSHYQAALELNVAKGAHDLRCACLQGLGVVAFSQGEFTSASEYIQEGLNQARRYELLNRQAALLSNQGTLLVSQAEPEEAMESFRESLRLARGMNDHALEGVLLSNLGSLAAQEGDLEAAGTYFEESYELARAGGDRQSMAILLHNLGTLANDRGELGQARDYFVQALGEARQMGDRAQSSRILANLGALHTAQGEYDEAESLLNEGLEQAEGIQHIENSILLLMNMAELARIRGEASSASSYLDRAEELASKSGHERYLRMIVGMKREQDNEHHYEGGR